MNKSRPGRVLGTVLAAFSISLTFTSCASYVDSAETEKDIASTMPEMLTGAAGKLAVKSVDCPDDPEYAKGKTFECDFTLEDGDVGKVSVTLESETQAEYGLVALGGSQMEAGLKELIEEKNKVETTADCPRTVANGESCPFVDKDGDTGTGTLSIKGTDIEVSFNYDD